MTINNWYYLLLIKNWVGPSFILFGEEEDATITTVWKGFPESCVPTKINHDSIVPRLRWNA